MRVRAVTTAGDAGSVMTSGCSDGSQSIAMADTSQISRSAPAKESATGHSVSTRCPTAGSDAAASVTTRRTAASASAYAALVTPLSGWGR